MRVGDEQQRLPAYPRNFAVSKEPFLIFNLFFGAMLKHYAASSFRLRTIRNAISAPTAALPALTPQATHTGSRTFPSSRPSPLTFQACPPSCSPRCRLHSKCRSVSLHHHCSSDCNSKSLAAKGFENSLFHIHISP